MACSNTKVIFKPNKTESKLLNEICRFLKGTNQIKLRLPPKRECEESVCGDRCKDGREEFCKQCERNKGLCGMDVPSIGDATCRCPEIEEGEYLRQGNGYRMNKKTYGIIYPIPLIKLLMPQYLILWYYYFL